MPRMTPKRLKEIEDGVKIVYVKHILDELIAEVKASWDDIDGLTEEIEHILKCGSFTDPTADGDAMGEYSA